MTNINNRLRENQGRNVQQLELFRPGEQGWQIAIANPGLLKPSLDRAAKLKTDQLKERYSIPFKILRDCPVGAIIAWKAYLIWHQGRDSWKIYAEE